MLHFNMLLGYHENIRVTGDEDQTAQALVAAFFLCCYVLDTNHT